MCAYPYRRRRRFRRRAPYFRYGRALRRWRRPRYRRWRRRVRRRPRWRRLYRRFRRRRWGRRYRRRRGRFPFPIIQWAPPVRTNCYIRGYCPLMWFTEKEVFRPFLDPPSGMYMGGGISVYYWTLEELWNQLTMQRNKWSKSNYGYNYGRFRWAKFRFFRTDYWSYVVNWDQGQKAEESLLWPELHPSRSILKRKRKIIRCNDIIPYRKRYSTRKLFIRPPPDMTNQWYPMCELSNKLLVRMSAVLIDLRSIWFGVHAPRAHKGYFSSIGYKTPDRRTLSKKFYLPDGEDTVIAWNAEWYNSRQEVEVAYTGYATWGGIINWKVSPDKLVHFNTEKMNNLYGINTTITGIYSQTLHTDPRKLSETTAVKLSTVWTAGGSYTLKYEVKPGFGNSMNTTLSNYKLGDKTAVGTTLTSPPAMSTQEAAVFQTKQRANVFDTSDFNTCDPTGTKLPLKKFKNCYKQCFWHCRYNPCYDSGHGNKVWGLWFDQSQPDTTYRLFANGDTGPGAGLYEQFSRHLVSENTPYYQEFYGHTYATYLTYLNLKYPRIVEQSLGHKGFFAVAITGWPAYALQSGAFPEGYAPMVYQGDNYEYYTKQYFDDHPTERWPKFWPVGQSYPPLNDKAEIDWNCRVFCILCDGRNVCYGQGLEGTLLYTDDYRTDGKRWGRDSYEPTQDDIGILGEKGPFCPKDWKGDEYCPNIYLSYTFKFQWGATKWPGQWTQVQQPSSFCDPGQRPLPPGFPDEDDYIPPGSPSRPGQYPDPRPRVQFTGPSIRQIRRRRAAPDSGEVVHPREASALAYSVEDLDKDGFIKDGVFYRLTSSSLDTLGRRVPIRRKIGTPEEQQLWSVYRGLTAGAAPPSSESSSYGSSEEAGPPPLESSPERWPFLQEVEDRPQQKRRRRYPPPSSDGESSDTGAYGRGPTRSERRRLLVQQLYGHINIRKRFRKLRHVSGFGTD
ncbi:ORF1 [torque teno Delphinidae virus 48]